MAEQKVINCAALHVPPESSVPPPGSVPGREARWTIPVEGMTCASCVARGEKSPARGKGVTEASVKLATKTATVTVDPHRAGPGVLVSAIRDTGYDVPGQRTEVPLGGRTCASCVARA